MSKTWAGLAIFVALSAVPCSFVLGYDVSVSVSPPKTANPGDLITLVFEIENIDTTSDSYSLNLRLPARWTSLPVPSHVGVAAGQTYRLFVTVMVPAGAVADDYEVRLRATSTHDTSASAEAAGVIRLAATAGLEVEALVVARAEPGEEAKHTIRVHNRGNVVDTYQIDVWIDQPWAMHAPEGKMQVLPGDHRDVYVTVLLPAAIGPGASYYVKIEATSTVDPDLVERIGFSASVAPPPPERVHVELYPRIPLSLRMDLGACGPPTFELSVSGDLPGIGRLRAGRSIDLSGVSDQDASFSTSGWGVDWGDVSISGAYGGISGKGIDVGFRASGTGGARFLFVEEGEAMDATLYCDGNVVRLLLVEVRDPLEHQVQEVQFSGSLGEGFSLAAILAGAQTIDGTTDALQIETKIGSEPVNGHMSFGDVSPGFPDQPEGTSLRGGLSFGGFQSTVRADLSAAKVITLTEPGPPKAFTTERRVVAMTSILPQRDLSFRLGFNWQCRESDDTPKTTDERTTGLELGIQGESSSATWSLDGSFTRTADDVEGTVLLSQSIGYSMEATIQDAILVGSLGLQRIHDLVIDAITDSNSSFSLSCSFPQRPFAPTLELSSENGQATLEAHVEWADTTGRSVTASVDVPLDVGGGGGVSLTVEFTYPITFPFLGASYGAIRGWAFIDDNGNRQLDPGEDGVSGLLLSTATQQAITGEEGRFVFWPLASGVHRVRIATAPFGVSPRIELPVEVELQVGEEAQLLIPMESRSRISGFIFHDLNQNGQRDSGEPGVGGVQVLIDGEQARETTRTTETGAFGVEVSAGSYTVSLVSSSLPARFETTTEPTVRVQIAERDSVVVHFGAWQRPREVVFGPQVPIAQFVHTPAYPALGETVSFDASTSRAMQGDLTSYEWEFRKGVTRVRAQGAQVTMIFEEAGTWIAALKVTDTAGRTGQRQKIIPIQ